jgi:hypothetical protein
MSVAIVFAERRSGALRWGFRVGPAQAALALMPPFAASADEAAGFAALFADGVEIIPPLVPYVGLVRIGAPRSTAA